MTIRHQPVFNIWNNNLNPELSKWVHKLSSLTAAEKYQTLGNTGLQTSSAFLNSWLRYLLEEDTNSHFYIL